MADTLVRPPVDPGPPTARETRPRPGRRVAAVVITVLAVVLFWVALDLPNRPEQLAAAAWLRLPAELVVLLLLALVLPRRLGTVVAAVLGVVIALVVLLKALDLLMLVGFYRTFDPLSDPSYLGSGYGVLRDSVGGVRAVLVATGAAIAAVGLLVLLPLAAVRLTRTARRLRRPAWVVVVVLALTWALLAVIGTTVGPDLRVASAQTSTVAADHVSDLRRGIADRAEFDRLAASDPFAASAPSQLLAGLQGKDVLVVFVESYGRVALEDPQLAPTVTAAVDRTATGLAASGYSARSAYLTSPTFGGLSWLAHSTLQTGLPITDQVRYNAVIDSRRLTLASAFGAAGWRTVLVSPADESDISPVTGFYGYDALYDGRSLGYQGPKFGYAPVPDQFTLATVASRELTPGPRAPVMAEIDLVSSHTPWAPLPRLLDPAALGDGSAYQGVLDQAATADAVWSSPARVKQAYADSVAYALASLTSFVRNAHDDNLVMVVLGDHQPAAVISGENASHDVPVSVVAKDPAVLDRVADWGWPTGMRPGRDAPVWPMDAFRDRVFTAFRSG
ncbi:MAG TPA: CDP-alcohol phosphatidyltransferase [Lapillicoccus sp.]|nr:CDP-alcohol phosphatidyltransferase [Lapillicoccus sp.]